MGLSDFKITDADITSKGVQASPDQLSGTAEDNKKVFDRLTSGPVRDGHNKLIDALVTLGVEQLIQYGSENIKYIRLNTDEHIEVSSDGVAWTEVASSGHLIYDAAGRQMPQRSRLKFGGASVVTDDGTYTIVNMPNADMHITINKMAKALDPDAVDVVKYLELDNKTMYDVISTSSGNSYVVDAKMKKFIMPDKFEPGFAMDVQYKDLTLAQEAARGVKMPIPMSATCTAVYEQARAAGYGMEDIRRYQALGKADGC